MINGVERISALDSHLALNTNFGLKSVASPLLKP
jgi:hypothetical protein